MGVERRRREREREREKMLIIMIFLLLLPPAYARAIHCLRRQMNSAQRRVVVNIHHHHQHVEWFAMLIITSSSSSSSFFSRVNKDIEMYVCMYVYIYKTIVWELSVYMNERDRFGKQLFKDLLFSFLILTK